MSFFMNDAMAAAVDMVKPQQTDSTFSLIMITAIFVLFYFMLIRPQNKRAKEHRDLVSKLKKGDEVIIAGGMVAKVSHIDEQYIKVMLTEGVEVTVQRTSVSMILPKGTLKSI